MRKTKVKKLEAVKEKPEHSYGTGTIDRLPNGKYRVRIPIGNGKRKSIGVFETEAEAETMRGAGLVARELPGGSAEDLLGEYGERWLTLTAPLRRNHRTDYSRWMVHVKNTRLGQTPINRVAPADITKWMIDALSSKGIRRTVGGKLASSARVVSRQTVKHALGLVRRALQDAVTQKKIVDNPADTVTVPPAEEDPTWAYLELEELTALLELELRPEVRAAIELSIYTGLRQGEVAGLRWGDIEELEGDAPRLTVRRSWGGAPKTKSSRRELYLLPAAADALLAWRPHWEDMKARRQSQDLVFPGEDGSVYAKGFDWGWAGKLEASRGVYHLGIRDRARIRSVRWHDLRHTCASHLVMGSWTARPWTLHEVRDYLGHTSVDVTQRYAHLGKAHRRAAVARAARPIVKTGHKTGHDRFSRNRLTTRNHSAGGEGFEPPIFDSGDPKERVSFQPLTPPRDQSVTGLAGRLISEARELESVAPEAAAELARAVLAAAPETVRLALELAGLEPSDPRRGKLAVELAAAVVAGLPPAARRGTEAGSN